MKAFYQFLIQSSAVAFVLFASLAFLGMSLGWAALTGFALVDLGVILWLGRPAPREKVRRVLRQVPLRVYLN